MVWYVLGGALASVIGVRFVKSWWREFQTARLLADYLHRREERATYWKILNSMPASHRLKRDFEFRCLLLDSIMDCSKTSWDLAVDEGVYEPLLIEMNESTAWTDKLTSLRRSSGASPVS